MKPFHVMNGGSVIPYHGVMPQIGAGSLVASGAHVIGDVIAGVDVSFWFNTVVRGDCNYIRIGDRTNIQDGTVIHVTHTTAPTIIGKNVTIGHSAVIHGCTIEDRCLIGMGAVLLDGAIIRTGSVVAAGTVVPPGKDFPAGSLILGNPGKPVRTLRDVEIRMLDDSIQNYLEYKRGYCP